MSFFGRKGVLLDCFHDYLTDRGHRVRVGCKCSTLLNNSIAVSQENILGPLLFFVNGDNAMILDMISECGC